MSYIPRIKKIALVDCNSFYVSCERLFKPHILKKPVVVLSNNDGCIISRSSEAKALGIKMGDPYFKAKEIIIKNNVHVFSSNYSLYGDISRRVMRILKYLAPEIEIYSIDEAFLDLSSIKDNILPSFVKNSPLLKELISTTKLSFGIIEELIQRFSLKTIDGYFTDKYSDVLIDILE